MDTRPYTGHGTVGDETGPMTLHDALSRVAALTAKGRLNMTVTRTKDENCGSVFTAKG